MAQLIVLSVIAHHTLCGSLLNRYAILTAHLLTALSTPATVTTVTQVQWMSALAQVDLPGIHQYCNAMLMCQLLNM